MYRFILAAALFGLVSCSLVYSAAAADWKLRDGTLVGRGRLEDVGGKQFMEGPWQFWNKEGVKIADGNYLRGDPNGPKGNTGIPRTGRIGTWHIQESDGRFETDEYAIGRDGVSITRSSFGQDQNVIERSENGKRIELVIARKDSVETCKPENENLMRCTLEKDGKPAYAWSRDANLIRQGSYLGYYKSGALMFDGVYKDGDLSGTATFFREDGTLFYTQQYQASAESGIFFEFYPDRKTVSIRGRKVKGDPAGGMEPFRPRWKADRHKQRPGFSGQKANLPMDSSYRRKCRSNNHSSRLSAV